MYRTKTNICLPSVWHLINRATNNIDFTDLYTRLHIIKLIVQVLEEYGEDITSIVGDFWLDVFRKLAQHVQGRVADKLVITADAIA